MSSILEALKKLEEEKAARRGGGGNIAGKVTAAGRRPRQRPVWLVPAGMAAAAAAAVLVTYAAMGGFSPRHGETVSPRGSEPASPPLAIAAPQSAAPDGSVGAAPAAVLPLPPAQGGSGAAATGQAMPPSPATVRLAAPPPSSEKLVPAEQTAALLQPAAGEQLPAFIVSGIAWQKDSASRLAVVNGTSVAEGNVIEGARVREILPDRVLFSFNRMDFEVQLGKGAP